MTKEELIAAGLTEEQANAVFAMNGRDINSLRGQITTLTEQNTQLQADSAELETLKKQNMTAEQLQQKAIDEANAKAQQASIKYNKSVAEKTLLAAGMTEDDYKDFIDGIVSESEETTLKIASSMATSFTNRLRQNEEQIKNELLKGTPRPNGADGSDGGTKKTPQQLIAEELASEGAETMNASKSALEYYGGK